MTDDEKKDVKPDHEPPSGAETIATWTGGGAPIDYTASAKWLVLRKKEKPAAEMFSVSYVAAGGNRDRPVTFVFNGGPGASSAYLHLGAVGPQRVDFPSDGSLPRCRHASCRTRRRGSPSATSCSSIPVGTGFSRVIEDEKMVKTRTKRTTIPSDPKEYFGVEARPRVVVRVHGPLAVGPRPLGLARVHRRRELRRLPGRPVGANAAGDAGVGLNGAILISPALEIATLSPTDYDVLGWIDTLPDDGGRCRHTTGARARSRAGAALEQVLGEAETFATGDYTAVPHPRRRDARSGARAHPRAAGRSARVSRSTWSSAPKAGSASAPSLVSSFATSARCSDCTTPRSPSPIRSPTAISSQGPTHAVGPEPRLHHGGEPPAPVGDRRRNRPRVHAC